MDEDNLPIPEDASELEFLEQEAKQNIFIESEDLPINEDVLKQQVGARQLGFGDDELEIIEGTAFKEIMDDMDAKGIHYSDVDIYSYIPESERLSPYLIFMEDVRNRWYTDEFVNYLVKVSASGAFETIGYNDLPFSPAAQIHEHALNISFRRGPNQFNNMLQIAIDADNPIGSLNPKKMKIKYINNIFPGGSYKATLEEQNRRFWEEKGMTPEGKWLPEVAERGIIRMVDADGNVTYKNFKGEPIPADDPRLKQYEFDDMTAKIEAEAYNKAEGPEKLKMMRDKDIITEYEYQELLKGNDPFTPEPDTPTNVVDDYITALKQEASKYKTFDEYEKAFSREYKRGIYYHLTDNPNFVVDLSKGATDAATGKMTPGSIMFTTDLDYWADTTWTDRPYVAILDLSDVDESQFTQVNRGQGNEFYLDDASKVKVKEVIPVDEALKQSELINQWGLNNLKNKEDLKNVIWDNRLDTPGGSLGAAKLNDPLVFDSWIDNLGKTTTSFVDNLPLETTVKNRVKNLIGKKSAQAATPGGLMDAVDVWEFSVLGLMAAAVAFKEYDEIPTIITNKAVDMFNSMTSFYGIPPVQKKEYDLDYEYITKVLDTGEKYMPTDIIIKKVGDVVKRAAETGAVTGFGYVPPNLTKTDTMETTQKIQPGVQEEKMFEKAKPKKIKPTGGAGAKIL